MDDKLLKHANRIKGQVAGIERMLTDCRDCNDVVVQIQAARASLASLGEELLKQEATSCMQIESPLDKEKKFAEIIKNLFKLT
jgi:DNA-binding FrmR family transcriptional regulator